MALNVGELTAYLKLDSTAFQSGLAAAPAEAGAAGTKMGNTMGTGILNTVKTFAAPIAATFGAMAIADFFKNAVTGASDFVEQGTAVGQVFGDGATAIQKEAATAAGALGQSKVQFLEAAKNFGIYGKAAGLAGEDNAKFSSEMVTLATDLASFNNTSVDDAITALGSGLRGEAEPLRKYGVLLDDATLRSKAMEMGIVKTTKDALTPQQKVLAAHAVILEQTKTQQGDFARTSEGLANQQRILDANMANLAITVGGFLLPAINGVVTVMNPFLQFIAEYAAPIGAFAAAIGILTLAYNAQAIATALVNSAVWANTAALLANPVTWIILGIAALIAIIVLLATHWDEVTKWVSEVWSGFIGWMTGVLDGFGVWWTGLWDSVGKFFSDLWNGIVKFFGDALGWLVDLFLNWTLLGLIIKNWDTIVKVTSDVWNGIVKFFSGIWTGISDGVSTWWNNMISFFKNLPANIVGFFSGIGKWLWDAGRNLIQGLFDGISSLAGNIGKFFLDLLPSWIVAPFKMALGIHSPSKVFEKFGANTMEGYVQGVVKMKGSVANTLKGAVSTPSVSNAVSSMGAKTGSGVGSTINYYAAENQSLSAEEALFSALSSPRVRVA